MTPYEEIEQMVTDLADVYKQDLTPRMLSIYVYALSDISVSRLERAIASWVATSQFFPQPNEIREANAKIPLTPEDHACARQRLLERIDYNPKQLASVLDKPRLSSALETYKNLPESVVRRMIEDALDPKPVLPLGAGMTAEQWQEHLRQMKAQFLERAAKEKPVEAKPMPNQEPQLLGPEGWVM